MTNQSDVARARTKSEIARAQMLGTLDALRIKVKPANLVSEAADKATRTAVRKPVAVAAVAGAVLAIFIAKPAYGAMRRCRSRRVATKAAAKHSQS